MVVVVVIVVASDTFSTSTSRSQIDSGKLLPMGPLSGLCLPIHGPALRVQSADARFILLHGHCHVVPRASSMVYAEYTIPGRDVIVGLYDTLDVGPVRPVVGAIIGWSMGQENRWSDSVAINRVFLISCIVCWVGSHSFSSEGPRPSYMGSRQNLCQTRLPLHTSFRNISRPPRAGRTFPYASTLSGPCHVLTWTVNHRHHPN
jgi:hypothetical protein